MSKLNVVLTLSVLVLAVLLYREHLRFEIASGKAKADRQELDIRTYERDYCQDQFKKYLLRGRGSKH